jgi:hypothetical protein
VAVPGLTRHRHGNPVHYPPFWTIPKNELFAVLALNIWQFWALEPCAPTAHLVIPAAALRLEWLARQERVISGPGSGLTAAFVSFPSIVVDQVVTVTPWGAGRLSAADG